MLCVSYACLPTLRSFEERVRHFNFYWILFVSQVSPSIVFILNGVSVLLSSCFPSSFCMCFLCALPCNEDSSKHCNSMNISKHSLPFHFPHFSYKTYNTPFSTTMFCVVVFFIKIKRKDCSNYLTGKDIPTNEILDRPTYIYIHIERSSDILFCYDDSYRRSYLASPSENDSKVATLAFTTHFLTVFRFLHTLSLSLVGLYITWTKNIKLNSKMF